MVLQKTRDQLAIKTSIGIDVNFEEIVPHHPWLPRHACRNDDNIRSLELLL